MYCRFAGKGLVCGKEGEEKERASEREMGRVGTREEVTEGWRKGEARGREKREMKSFEKPPKAVYICIIYQRKKMTLND